MNGTGLVAFFLGAVCGSLLLASLLAVTHSTYKYGQIDAINGNIKYHLVTQDTGEWEEIKE